MAVLPTPGGPTRHALFFRLRSRIWMTRSISASRPTTGSSSPSRAIWVRSVATSSSVVFLSPPLAPTAANCFSSPPLRAPSTAARSLSASTPNSASTRSPPQPSSWAMARRRCSQPTSPDLASRFAWSKIRLALSEKGRELPRPLPSFASPRVDRRSATARRTASRVTPLWVSAAFATLLPALFCSSAITPRSTSSVHTTP
mmetsp:Transcript_69062/g.202706  ORF Transcript_69062/g.202706 Transcript_69062/m.202706 type:complete len:201 (-) Transcript_69062:187-789(-)